MHHVESQMKKVSQAHARAIRARASLTLLRTSLSYWLRTEARTLVQNWRASMDQFKWTAFQDLNATRGPAPSQIEQHLCEIDEAKDGVKRQTAVAWMRRFASRAPREQAKQGIERWRFSMRSNREVKARGVALLRRAIGEIHMVRIRASCREWHSKTMSHRQGLMLSHFKEEMDKKMKIAGQRQLRMGLCRLLKEELAASVEIWYRNLEVHRQELQMSSVRDLLGHIIHDQTKSAVKFLKQAIHRRVKGNIAALIGRWRGGKNQDKALQAAAFKAAMRVKIRQITASGKEAVLRQLCNILNRLRNGSVQRRMRSWYGRAVRGKFDALLSCVKNKLSDTAKGTGMRLLQQTFKRMVKGAVAYRLTVWRQGARIAVVQNLVELQAEKSLTEVESLKLALERSTAALLELGAAEERNRSQLTEALTAQEESSAALQMWEAVWNQEKTAIKAEFDRRDREEVENMSEWRSEKGVLEASLHKYVADEVRREAEWGEKVADLTRVVRGLENELRQCKAEAATEMFRLMRRIDAYESADPTKSPHHARGKLTGAMAFLKRWGEEYIEGSSLNHAEDQNSVQTNVVHTETNVR